MCTIDEHDFRGIDLNLLVTFMVLYRERSVTTAAKRLYLGQPAVSGALARLRALFDDPLFVRVGGVMVPTTRADEIATTLAPVLGTLHHTLFSSEAFDPAISRARIRLATADWLELWLMPRLLGYLATYAPHMQVHVHGTTPFDDLQHLQQGDVDMAVSVNREQPRWLKRQRLMSHGFTAIWSPDMTPLAAPLTLDTYLAYPHLLVSYLGRARSAIDDRLDALQRARFIRYTTSRFSSLPGMLMHAPSIATVSERLARQWVAEYGFVTSPVPLETQRFDVSLLWHARDEHDPVRRWLAGVIEGVVGN